MNADHISKPSAYPIFDPQADSANRTQRKEIVHTLLRATLEPDHGYEPLTPEQIHSLWQQHQALVADYQPKYDSDEAIRFLEHNAARLTIEQPPYPVLAVQLPQLAHVTAYRVTRRSYIHHATPNLVAWGDCLAEALDHLVDHTPKHPRSQGTSTVNPLGVKIPKRNPRSRNE